MSEVPFHQTRMGARFYESTVPELVRQLELLNRNLERLIETQSHGDDHDGHDPRTEEEEAPPHA